MSNSKIQRAIALGITADTTDAQRAMRQVHGIIAQVREPVDRLKAQMHFLRDSFNEGAISSQQFSDAMGKAGQNADKQNAKLRKLREETSGWASGLRQLGMSQVAQDLQRSKAGADAWSAGMQTMKQRTDEAAAAVRASQAALSGWANGLRQLGMSQVAQDLKRSKAGADAWAAGMRAMRQQAEEAARAQRTLREEGRQFMRQFESDLQRTNRLLDEASALHRRGALTARQFAAARHEIGQMNSPLEQGAQYMRQFESVQQRVNRQLVEAGAMYRRGAITAMEYGAAVRSIRGETSLVSRSLSSLKGTMLGLVGVTTVAYAGFNFLRRSVQLAADLETTRARMKVLTGSVADANEQIAQLRELASKGISFTGGQSAAATMLQFGVASESVIQSIKQIGEITGGDAQRMQMLSLAFAQTTAAGRLMGQDLLQMVNAGFNPLKVISEQTGQSLVELKKQMEAGAISSETVTQAFRDATAEGGRFHGLLDEIANTAAGKFIRARSEVEKLQTAIGEMLTTNKGVIDVFIDDVGRLTRSLEILSSLKLPSWLSGGNGSVLRGLATPAALRLAQLPSFIADYRAATADIAAEVGRFDQSVADKAQAISRLDQSGYGGMIGKDEVARAEQYLSTFDRIKSLAEQVRAGEKVDILPSDATSVKDMVAELELRDRTAKRVDAAEFQRLREQYQERRKLAKSLTDSKQAGLDFIKDAGQGYFSDKELATAAKIRAELEATAKNAQQLARVSKEFAAPTAKAEEAVIDARYGNDAERVKLLVAQSVDKERERLDILVAQGAAYQTIVAAANMDAQTESRRLEALDAQKVKILELAKADKERTDAATKATEKLKEDAERIKRDANPFADFIDGLGRLQAMFAKGLINASEYDRERDRLVNDNAKTEKLNAAPRIEKGSQEAFKALTQQTVDRAELQLTEAKRANVLAATEAEVNRRRLTVLEEIRDAQPVTVGP